jgi:hypothetical protein
MQSNKGWHGSYYELLKGAPAYNTQALSTIGSPLLRAPHSYDEHVSAQGEHAMGVVTTYTGTLKDGFIGADSFCNLEGCYRLNVDLPATQKGAVDTATAKTIASTSFFSVCGHRGRIPFSAPLCIDPVYGKCYGVTGCPVIKSYVKRSSRLNAFISYDMSGKETFVENLAVRGIRELCTLKPLCYKVVVAGRNDSNGLFDLCGTTVQAPAMGTLCVGLNAQNNTVCTSNTLKTSVCPATTVNGVKQPQTSILIVKYAREGMGWGDEVNYNIYSVGSTQETPPVYTGTLRDGSMGTDALCFPVGHCFIFMADSDPMDPFGFNTNLWIMCG